MLGVAAAVFLGLTGVVEAFECVLAQGFEETKAVLVASGPSSSWIIDLAARSSRPSRTSQASSWACSVYRGCGICVEAPGEDADTIEDDALVFVEERIGPFDGGPQRLMPLDSATAPAGEEPEPFVEQPRDLAPDSCS